MIKSVRFGNVDTLARKGLAAAFHGMVSAMLAQKRKGDHVEVTMDDGTVLQFKIKDHGVDPHDNSFNVSLTPGVE